jgi:hypothetical protein
VGLLWYNSEKELIMKDAEIIEIRKATRANPDKPFADTLAFAKAILESRELAGWMIVDKNGVEAHTKPKMGYYIGSLTPTETKELDVLTLEYMDREYSGLAPHTIRKIYF